MSTGIVVPPFESHTHAPGTAAESTSRNVTGRFGPAWSNHLKAWLGMPWQRRLARGALLLGSIRSWENEYDKLNDEELKQKAARVRGRARGGESLDKLLPEAFGMVCVAAKRTIGMRPFDVQIVGGAVMHYGGLAELVTGEGKTLTASLPTFLNGLTGKGVHVTTVNDYLAKRDAEWIGPVYQMLGLSVGVLQQKQSEPIRKAAYNCDITYGTSGEYGFDFLRDQMKLRGGAGGAPPFWTAWEAGGAPVQLDPRLQRDPNFALVDEADAIFVDEARTPLIIALSSRNASPEESIVYMWANELAKRFRDTVHYNFDFEKDKIELTDAGRQEIRWSNPPSGEHSHAMDKLFEHVERACHCHYRYMRDVHYMVVKDKVVLLDEFSGRSQPDRHWREGMHQAAEAKEAVTITKAAEHAAKITFQTYFRLYKKLAGMTGTAAQNFIEIRRVFKIWVVCVPTNKPVLRKHLPDRVFPTEDAKFAAITAEVQQLQAAGRPVLIGTRSVEKSEKLSQFFTDAGVEHKVLNAKYHEMEAQIIAEAGQAGRVTVSTNMAGRGTDIKLGPGVAAAGGLHVIGTERHDAKRVDRQLVGRAGRQGDPGSGQFYVALDDDLLEALGEKRQERLKKIGLRGGNQDWDRFAPLFEKAQRKRERKHYLQRLDLMHSEKQRKETLEDLGADPYVD